MSFSKFTSAIKHDVYREDRYKMWAFVTLAVVVIVATGIPVILTAPDGAKGLFFMILFVMVYIFGMANEVNDILRQEDERLIMEEYGRSCDEYQASLDRDPNLSDEDRRHLLQSWCQTTMPIHT